MISTKALLFTTLSLFISQESLISIQSASLREAFEIENGIPDMQLEEQIELELEEEKLALELEHEINTAIAAKLDDEASRTLQSGEINQENLLITEDAEELEYLDNYYQTYYENIGFAPVLSTYVSGDSQYGNVEFATPIVERFGDVDEIQIAIDDIKQIEEGELLLVSDLKVSSASSGLVREILNQYPETTLGYVPPPPEYTDPTITPEEKRELKAQIMQKKAILMKAKPAVKKQPKRQSNAGQKVMIVKDYPKSKSLKYLKYLPKHAPQQYVYEDCSDDDSFEMTDFDEDESESFVVVQKLPKEAKYKSNSNIALKGKGKLQKQKVMMDRNLNIKPKKKSIKMTKPVIVKKPVYTVRVNKSSKGKFSKESMKSAYNNMIGKMGRKGDGVNAKYSKYRHHTDEM